MRQEDRKDELAVAAVAAKERLEAQRYADEREVCTCGCRKGKKKIATIKKGFTLIK